MDESTVNHEQLIKNIYDLEWEMFHEINPSSPAACQQNPKAFRLMRWMTHSVLPDEVLQSYLDDLQQAIKEEHNLMAEKYLRMEKVILPLKNNPIIEQIINIETEWFRAVAEEYPLTFQGDGQNFTNYLTCELETYSNHTLELYCKTLIQAKEKDSNLVKERYTNFFSKLGYSSIKQREEECEKTNQRSKN